MAHDVFISFSFADQQLAENIVNTLTSKYGISCWICTRDVQGGKCFKRLIPDAIRASKVVVFLQSENAVESKEIPKEIGIAFDSDKTIIPFKLDQAKLKGDMEYDLYGIEYIDATVPTMEQRIHDLAKTILKSINEPVLTDDGITESDFILKSHKIVCSEIFAGRESLIENIHEAFTDRNVVFLFGMGGIGKSELARQYWKKYKQFYNTVVFAHYTGDLAELIANDKVFNLIGCSRKMKDGNSFQTNEEYARDKLAILKKTADEHTLLIIDNFDILTKDDPFWEEVTCDAEYRIIVTTRCEPDIKKEYAIPVREIDDNTLKKLFIQYANPQKTIIELDDPNFPELIQLTNHHTYTLELVARFMEERDDIDYLSEMIEFLKKRGFSDIEVNGYDSISKLFHLTTLSNNEKQFLRCLALMPSGGINQKLFKKWIGDAFSARSRLVDLSLVKINGESKTIALHPVIKEIVLTDLRPSYETCKDFIDRCAMTDVDADPIMWGLPYEEKVTLLECYKSILNVITDINMDTYQVYMNISYMYNFAGNYSLAIALHKRIYNFARMHFGEYSAETMLIFNHIAWINSYYHYYEQALTYYKTAADWFYANPCYWTRESHDALRSCAEAHYYLFKQTKDPLMLKKAYEYLDKASEYGQRMIEATVDASEHFKAHLKFHIDCMCRNYLILYFNERKYDLVEKCLEKYIRAIEEFTKFDPVTSDADTASYYRYLSKLKFELGHYDEALNALQRSYHLYLNCFSNRNPRVVEMLEELALCCMKLKDYKKANLYLSEAIDNAKAIFTEDHPTLLRLKDRQINLNKKTPVESEVL